MECAVSLTGMPCMGPVSRAWVLRAMREMGQWVDQRGLSPSAEVSQRTPSHAVFVSRQNVCSGWLSLWCPWPSGDFCSKCLRTILGTVTTALDRKWHMECFTCGRCGRPIIDKCFAAVGDVPYHSSCDPGVARSCESRCVNFEGFLRVTQLE